MKEGTMKIQYKVKKRRVVLGLTQRQVANKIGITRSHYANLENGHREMTKKYLNLIARTFGTPRHALRIPQ